MPTYATITDLNGGHAASCTADTIAATVGPWMADRPNCTDTIDALQRAVMCGADPDGPARALGLIVELVGPLRVKVDRRYPSIYVDDYTGVELATVGAGQARELAADLRAAADELEALSDDAATVR
jgi:hypothetical protein